MKIGAKVPNSGPLPLERGMAAMAMELEGAGFESLWVSDHVVMPCRIESLYPFAADGKPTWPLDTPYFDAMVALASIATVTKKAAIGTAVLVLPQRHPIVLAKQVASIDALSGGRLVLGVGAGWLEEEFTALGAPFTSRGERFVEWVRLLRACWTGEPQPFEGKHYVLPEPVFCRPTPSRRVPVLVGGHSGAALARAGVLGDGWVAHQSARALDPEEVSAGVRKMRVAAEGAGRDPRELWTVLRVIDSALLLERVIETAPRFREAGVDEVVVDIDWGKPSSAAEAFNSLKMAVDR